MVYGPYTFSINNRKYPQNASAVPETVLASNSLYPTPANWNQNRGKSAGDNTEVERGIPSLPQLPIQVRQFTCPVSVFFRLWEIVAAQFAGPGISSPICWNPFLHFLKPVQEDIVRVLIR